VHRHALLYFNSMCVAGSLSIHYVFATFLLQSLHGVYTDPLQEERDLGRGLLLDDSITAATTTPKNSVVCLFKNLTASVEGYASLYTSSLRVAQSICPTFRVEFKVLKWWEISRQTALLGRYIYTHTLYCPKRSASQSTHTICYYYCETIQKWNVFRLLLTCIESWQK